VIVLAVTFPAEAMRALHITSRRFQWMALNGFRGPLALRTARSTVEHLQAAQRLYSGQIGATSRIRSVRSAPDVGTHFLAPDVGAIETVRESSRERSWSETTMKCVSSRPCLGMGNCRGSISSVPR
jgi:hypothetical protein